MGLRDVAGDRLRAQRRGRLHADRQEAGQRQGGPCYGEPARQTVVLERRGRAEGAVAGADFALQEQALAAAVGQADGRDRVLVDIQEAEVQPGFGTVERRQVSGHAEGERLVRPARVDILALAPGDQRGARLAVRADHFQEGARAAFARIAEADPAQLLGIIRARRIPDKAFESGREFRQPVLPDRIALARAEPPAFAGGDQHIGLVRQRDADTARLGALRREIREHGLAGARARLHRCAAAQICGDGQQAQRSRKACHDQRAARALLVAQRAHAPAFRGRF